MPEFSQQELERWDEVGEPDFIFECGSLKFSWMPHRKMLKVWEHGKPIDVISVWGRTREEALASLERVYPTGQLLTDAK